MRHLLLFLIVLLPLAVSAQVTDEQIQKILASDGAADDEFGGSVCVSGNYAVVGAWGDDDNGNISGAAYICSKNQGGTDNWGQVKKITANDGAADDEFGTSVCISGNYVIVGALGDDDNGNYTGAAYIFYKDQGGTDNWGQVKKITASDGSLGDKFGSSVSLYGNYAVVGAWADDDNGSQSGSVYIYSKDQGGTDNWGLVKKIISSDGAANDNFGCSVSISGSCLIVGAMGDDDNGSISGSAYIYFKDLGGTDNWGELKKITASDGAGSDLFGRSVSIFGNYAIVGADYDDDNGSLSGSAYIYYKDQGGNSNWGELKKITASDGTGSDFFGKSVTISGNYALVGATGVDDNGSNSGSAYIFYKDQGGTDNWGELKKITTSDGATDDNFGISVGLSGKYAIVGAYGDDDNGSESGSSYIFGPSMPTVNTQPVDQTNSCSGSAVEYSLAGTNIGSYQWQVSTDGGSNFSNISNGSVYSGVTNDTLTVTVDQSLDSYKYRCKVTNTHYPAPVTNHLDRFYSDTVDLTLETQKPTLTPQHDTVYLDPGGQYELKPSAVVAGASDNCSLADTTLSKSIFTGNDVGVVTIDITVSDVGGNNITRQADVFVEDTTRPALTTRDTTIYLDAAGSANIKNSDVISSASDNCEILDTLLSQSSFACGDTGKTVINVTVNDVNGNSSIQTADVTVKDTISPVFSISDTTLYMDTSGKASLKPGEVVTGATDNCSLADTVLSQSVFSCKDTGQTTITVTVQDISNNSDTQRLGVIVKDTIKPTLSCPSDQTVDADDSGTYTVQGDEFDLKSYNDNCGVTLLTNDFNESQTLADAKIPAGTHDMNWEVIDASGNSQTCSFDLKVSEYTSITGLKEKDIQVYPNPTDGKLQIESGKAQIKRLTLTTLSGKEVIVKTGVEFHETIDLSGLATGIYILRIQSIEGLSTKKIIHQ